MREPWADRHHLGLAIHLALNLGLREGEVCGLKWECIDLIAHTLMVRWKWQKKVRQLEDYPKGKTPLVLGLYQPGLLERLQRHHAIRGSSPFVVCDPDGTMVKPTQLSWMLRKAVEQTGIRRIHFHCLRHTFAPLYMQSGGSLYDLQKLMGHKSVATTERYRHTDPGYLKARGAVLNLYAQSDARKTHHLVKTVVL